MRNSIASAPKISRTPVKLAASNSDPIVQSADEEEPLAAPAPATVPASEQKIVSPVPSMRTRSMRNAIASVDKLSRTPVKLHASTPVPTVEEEPTAVAIDGIAIEDTNCGDDVNKQEEQELERVGNEVAVECKEKEMRDRENLKVETASVNTSTSEISSIISTSAPEKATIATDCIEQFTVDEKMLVEVNPKEEIIAAIEKNDEANGEALSTLVGQKPVVDASTSMDYDVNDTVESVLPNHIDRIIDADGSKATSPNCESTKKISLSAPSSLPKDRIVERAHPVEDPIVPDSVSDCPVAADKPTASSQSRTPPSSTNNIDLSSSDIKWTNEHIVPEPTAVSVNASSFPSAPAFDEMVNLSISMINGQSSIPSASNSNVSTIKTATAAITTVAPEPLDTMGRFLLHPTEFKELLKAFRSPPKRKKIKSSPVCQKKSGQKKKTNSPGLFKKNVAASCSFSIDDPENIGVKSFVNADKRKEEEKKRLSLLTTATTVFAAAAAAADANVEELDCLNPFVVKNSLNNASEAYAAASAAIVTTKIGVSVDDHVTTTSDAAAAAAATTTTTTTRVTAKYEEEIPMMMDFDDRLSFERQSIEPFRRMSLDVRRQSGQSLRRLPRGSLCGPVDEGMIDEAEPVEEIPKPKARNSEVAFLKEEVLRLRQELSNQHNEARNERQFLIDRLSQLEVNIKKQQEEDALKAQCTAEIKTVDINIEETQFLLRRLALEQEDIIQRQMRRSKMQNEIDNDIAEIAISVYQKASPESLSPPVANFDEYSIDYDAGHDDAFEMNGEFMTGRSSMEVDIEGNFSPVQGTPLSSTFTSQKLFSDEVNEPIHENRMKFNSLKSKKESIVVPKVEKIKVVRSSKSSSLYDEVKSTKQKTSKPKKVSADKKPKEPEASRMTFVPLSKQSKSNKRKLIQEDQEIDRVMSGDINDFIVDDDSNELIEEDVSDENVESPSVIRATIPVKKGRKKNVKKAKTSEKEDTEIENANNADVSSSSDIDAELDARAFDLFSKANLDDVKKMKPNAKKIEIDGLLQQLWDVATKEERAQWYNVDGSTSAIVSSSSVPTPTLPVPSSSSSQLAPVPTEGLSRKKKTSTVSNEVINDEKIDFFPASPEKKKRAARKQKAIAKSKDAEVSKEEEEISKQLDAITEKSSKPAIAKPKNLMLASDVIPLPNEDDSQRAASPLLDKPIKPTKSAKVSKAEPAPFVFKSRALMMLQEKENASDISTDSKGDEEGKAVKSKGAKGTSKGKSKGKKGEKENYFAAEEQECEKNNQLNAGALRQLPTKEKASEFALLSSRSEISLLNSSVSSIASVLSQNSGKSTFMVPKLRKKGASK